MGDRAHSQCFSLRFQVDLGVDISGIEGDMAEPASDRIDIHARTQKVGRAGMANGVRADALP